MTGNEELLIGALKRAIDAWEQPGPMGTMYEMIGAVAYAKTMVVMFEKAEKKQ